MGNFSRDTFKLTNTMYQQITGEKVKDPKHYVGVRLQQGVPMVDADWNELEDIRKYEQRAFLKWVAGDGVPQGSDGFRIKDATVNDFTVNNGVCYVDGWEVINIVNTQYTKQDLYNNNKLAVKWGVDPLSSLQMGPGQYTVYLDVWEREIDKQEDDRIVNDAIGLETCVRIKREWVVRVAEGDQAPAAKTDHAHYKLAILKVQQAPRVSVTVTDFRRTGLAVLSKEITIKDGKVGIGTTTPDKLPLCILSSDELWGSGISLDNRPAAGGKRYCITSNRGKLSISDMDNTEDRLVIDSNGNVGIGTTNPTAKLSVGTNALTGTAHSATFKTNAGALGTNADDELALASIGFLSKNASAFGIRAYRTKKGDDWTTTAIGFGMDVDNNVRASTTPGFSARALWLNANGYVGIGNSAPRETLDVNGRIICRNTRKKIEKNDARTYANNGNWETVPDMHTTFTVGQNSILIIFKAGVKFKGEVLFSLYVDNQPKANTRIKSGTEDKTDVTLTVLEIDKFPGEHDIRVEWLPTTGSTATISDLQMTRQLLIIEL